MDKLKVGFLSYEDMKSRTLAIARGELHTSPDDPKIWFTSIEAFVKTLGERLSAKVQRGKSPKRQMMPENKSLAERMWEAQWEYRRILLGPFEEMLPEGWVNYTHDDYDYSVEIYGIDRKLTADELKKLWDFGFYQVWTHSETNERHTAGHDAKENHERHYCRGKYVKNG